MPIQLAESMWVNLKKKVSMDMFTLENSKKSNGEGTLTRPEGKVESGHWENSKLVA